MKTVHPRNIVHPSMWGLQGGISPPAGSGGLIPPGGSEGKKSPDMGVWGTVFLDGGSGVKPPKEKLPCKCIL
jgi:hypothetical protein